MIQGIDTSKYVDDWRTPKTVDWEQCKVAGCRFVIMRATLSTDQQDVVYKLHKEALSGILPRGSYHYYRTTSSISDQVRYYYNFAGCLEIAPVMDLEDYYKELPYGQALINTTEKFLAECDQAFGQETILYTSYDIIKNYMALPAGHPLTKRKLWIANYGVKKPHIAPWTEYLLWQYSDTVDDQGRNATYYGFNECFALDMNKFPGSEEDFAKFTSGAVVDPIPPVIGEFTLKAQMEMRVRTAPNLLAPVIGSIPIGATIKPIGIGGVNAWAELSPGRWTCVQLDTEVFYK
jgi:GH25 family lysozyme M1 (1,4-beta-N-acetylmuramidase)